MYAVFIKKKAVRINHFRTAKQNMRVKFDIFIP